MTGETPAQVRILADQSRRLAESFVREGTTTMAAAQLAPIIYRHLAIGRDAKDILKALRSARAMTPNAIEYAFNVLRQPTPGAQAPKNFYTDDEPPEPIGKKDMAKLHLAIAREALRPGSGKEKMKDAK